MHPYLADLILDDISPEKLEKYANALREYLDNDPKYWRDRYYLRKDEDRAAAKRLATKLREFISDKEIDNIYAGYTIYPNTK